MKMSANMRRGLAVVYYMTCAILITIVNKMLFHPSYHFSDPLLVSCGQLVFTLLLLYVFSWCHLMTLPKWTWEDAKAMSPLSLTYVGMLFFGLAALSLTNLVMYNTLRRTGIFFVIALQYLLLGVAPSLNICGSVVVLFLGTAVAASTDLTFSFQGYFWAFLCNFATSLYIVLVKKIRNETKLDPVGILYYNTVLAFPLVAFLYAVMGESSDLASKPAMFWVYLLSSWSMGFFINHSIFVNTSENSPLTQAVSGQAKDIILLFVSFFVDYVFDPRNLAGVLLGFFGSILYAYIKYKEDNSPSQPGKSAV
jgi:drug/metabolite transporter (DMT)-like permease